MGEEVPEVPPEVKREIALSSLWSMMIAMEAMTVDSFAGISYGVPWDKWLASAKPFAEAFAGQGKRQQELERLYRKLNRYREEILHLASNHLLETVLHWQCKTIVLEDLRNYKPPKHCKKISRKLSNWLRGALYDILGYKTKRFGIKIVRVNPRWTSSFCPRCGAKGEKISDPRSLHALKRGRFFQCISCCYLADRDYIAAINIYRVYQEHRKKRFSLKHAKPVPYMATGIPLNRPSGDTIHRLLQTVGG